VTKWKPSFGTADRGGGTAVHRVVSGRNSALRCGDHKKDPPRQKKAGWGTGLKRGASIPFRSHPVRKERGQGWGTQILREGKETKTPLKLRLNGPPVRWQRVFPQPVKLCLVPSQKTHNCQLKAIVGHHPNGISLIALRRNSLFIYNAKRAISSGGLHP